MSHKKITDISLGLFALIVGWVFYKAVGTLSEFYQWSLLKDEVISVEAIVGLVVAVGVFVGLKQSKKITVFVEEVVVEMGKVTWPNKKETLVSGAVVLVMVGIASLIMSVFDSVWGTLSQKILTF